MQVFFPHTNRHNAATQWETVAWKGTQRQQSGLTVSLKCRRDSQGLIRPPNTSGDKELNMDGSELRIFRNMGFFHAWHLCSAYTTLSRESEATMKGGGGLVGKNRVRAMKRSYDKVRGDWLRGGVKVKWAKRDHASFAGAYTDSMYIHSEIQKYLPRNG